MNRVAAIAVAVAATLGVSPAWAQEHDHSVHQQADPEVEQTPPEAADPHAGHRIPPPTEAADPHAGHAMPPVETADPHAGHAMPPTETVDPHAGHAMPASSVAPREPIPPLTPADRAAAFPDVAGHAVHDKAVHAYWLLDQLETWDADEAGTAVGWEALAWIGTDLDRIWLRSGGEHVGGDLEHAELEVMYGRAVAPWWDLLAGVRHDFGHGPSQTFAAIGVVGLAPYKFEVEATAYIGQSGQTAARLEAEYETLLTNRLILQWLAEAEFHGKDDPSRGIGSGLGTLEAGLRLRYEIRREFAPYVGVAWERAYGRTADFREAGSEDVEDTRVVAGVRIWF